MAVDATSATDVVAGLPSLEASVEAALQKSSGWFSYLAWLVWSLVYNIVKLVTITIPTFVLTPFSAKWTLTLHATTL
jgi:lysophospholipid hydrolase